MVNINIFQNGKRNLCLHVEMPWSDNVSGHPIADVTLSACKNSSIELERRGQAVRNSEIEETAQWLKAIGCTEEIAEKFIGT